jgi:hypothetical protein
MKKLGYQALGFGVWQGVKWYAQNRDAPRKVAVGGLLFAVIGALLFAGRRAASD